MATHLGHVHLKIRDLDRGVTFYTTVLDLTERERTGRYAFLTFGDHHHDVALQAVRNARDDPQDGPRVGLYHAAFEVDTADELAAVADRLADRGVDVTPVDHGISRALYFDDPAGNGLEVYHDTRDAPDEEWEGQNRPFDPEA
jgi:catechol 2,3-dioxygenase